jgi:hypothetical protein
MPNIKKKITGEMSRGDSTMSISSVGERTREEEICQIEEAIGALNGSPGAIMEVFQRGLERMEQTSRVPPVEDISWEETILENDMNHGKAPRSQGKISELMFEVRITTIVACTICWLTNTLRKFNISIWTNCCDP